MSKREDRTGETGVSNEGYKMKIVEYIDANHITIEFQDEYKARKHVEYGNFKKGSIKNPYHPSVYGVGYEGEGKYSFKKDKKAHERFRTMIQRGYDLKLKERRPTYMDVIVAKENNIKVVANYYRMHIPSILYETLMNYTVEITD